MPGVLLDLRTGDPILENGDYIQVDDNYAFYQIIDNLLNCQLRSEIWNIYYGFDLQEAIKMNSGGAPVEIIESLLADALDPEKEILIYRIISLEAYRDENDPQRVRARFSLQSRLGGIITIEQTLGESL